MEEYSPVRYTVEERRYLLMMKWIKRLCSFILLCLLIAGGILLFQGYREYREALSGKSVEEMARQIESIDNYTSLDELPQTYIDAVLAVEDKRFYEHPGIDPIAIGRALLNDSRGVRGRRKYHNAAARQEPVLYTGKKTGSQSG